MDKVIRKNSFRVNAERTLHGFFVYDQSHATGLNIPHLPILNDQDLSQLLRHESVQYFSPGDIIYVNSEKHILRNVLSSNSNENTLLLTEQCENRCLFCSQPPNDKPDTHLYNSAALNILNFNSTSLIGLTGGEPTINQEAFLTLLKILHSFNNKTPLHILSNGRRLGDLSFFNQVTNALHDREVIWGIPLYGHKSSIHNMLVAHKDAFNETISGLLNLSSSGSLIELRVVVTQHNYRHLLYIFQFIDKNFPNITMISVMNLEPIGWARKNFETLFVSVHDQSLYLLQLIKEYTPWRFDIRLMNYPLCLLPEDIREYSVKSISDWKNYYPYECNSCLVKQKCGGYFTSSNSQFIDLPRPIQ